MQKQVQFLAYAFGGPEKYTGKDLKVAHARLIKEKGLNETHFDMVAGHFKATLEELGVPPDLVGECLEVVATARPIFETKGPIDARRAESLEKAVEEKNLDKVLEQIEELKLESDAKVNELKSQVKKMVEEKEGVQKELLDKLKEKDAVRAAALEAVLAEPADT